MGPVTWQTAERDQDEEAIPRSQTRATRPASSTKRRAWYGLGSLTRVEKSWFGRLLDDLVYAYADITVFSLPMLLYVWVTQPVVDLELTAPGLAAWVTMVGVATLIRGGWIEPVGSGTPGWVSARYSLLPFRVIYYNLALIVAIFGGLALEMLVGFPGTAAVCAACVGTSASLVFPTVVDVTYYRLVR